MKKLPYLFLLITTAFYFNTAQANVEHYKIDPAHSHIIFRIRHFVSKVAGSFEKFEGDIYFDQEKVSNSKAKLIIYAGSVDTNHDERDAHLRTDDFFFVESYPTLEFESVSWLQQDINTYEVFGYLTMLGKKLPLTMYVDLIGIADKKQTTISGWEGRGKLDRTEWDMGYGSPALGTEVEFDFQVEAIKQ